MPTALQAGTGTKHAIIDELGMVSINCW